MHPSTNKRAIYESYLKATSNLDVALQGNGPLGFDLLLRLSEARSEAVNRLESLLCSFYEDSAQALCSQTKSGNLWVMTKSLREPYVVQITYFAGESVPMGDMQFSSVQSAMQEMLRSTRIEELKNYNEQTFDQYLDEGHTNEYQQKQGHPI